MNDLIHNNRFGRALDRYHKNEVIRYNATKKKRIEPYITNKMAIETVVEIYSFISFTDMALCSRVCKMWKEAVNRFRAISIEFYNEWNDDKMRYVMARFGVDNLVGITITWYTPEHGFDVERMKRMLAHFTNLKRFSFICRFLFHEQNRPMDEALMPLCNNPNLERLTLQNCQLDDPICTMERLFEHNSRMKVIRVICSAMIDDYGGDDYADRRKKVSCTNKLRVLSSHLSKMSRLHRLEIDGDSMSFHAFDYKHLLPGLGSLKRIAVRNPNEEALEIMAQCCPKLESLLMCGSETRFTLKGLLAVLRSCPLQSLSLPPIISNLVSCEDIEELCWVNRTLTEIALLTSFFVETNENWQEETILIADRASKGRVKLSWL